MNGVPPTPSARNATKSRWEPTSRRTYLALRLEEIAVELGGLAPARDRLFADLETDRRHGAPEKQEIRERHAYLEERLEIVAMEQAALVSEREADALVRATTARRPRLVHSTPG